MWPLDSLISVFRHVNTEGQSSTVDLSMRREPAQQRVSCPGPPESVMISRRQVTDIVRRKLGHIDVPGLPPPAFVRPAESGRTVCRSDPQSEVVPFSVGGAVTTPR